MKSWFRLKFYQKSEKYPEVVIKENPLVLILLKLNRDRVVS